jgi:hypothetical protein
MGLLPNRASQNCAWLQFGHRRYFAVAFAYVVLNITNSAEIQCLDPVCAAGQSSKAELCSVQTRMQVPICTTAHQIKHYRHRLSNVLCVVMLMGKNLR